MGLTIDLETGRTAFRDSVEAFVRAAEGFDEWALLGGSRCHGWTRLDVIVHVVTGWQEMLQGFVSVVESAPTVDAASYWPAFDEESAGDPVAPLMAQRRRTAAHVCPDSAREQMRDVAAAVLRGLPRRGVPVAGPCLHGRRLPRHLGGRERDPPA